MTGPTMAIKGRTGAGLAAKRVGAAPPNTDSLFVYAVLAIIALGLVMMSSASFSIAERQFGKPLYFAIRQAMYIGFGLCFALLLCYVPLRFWEKSGAILLPIAIVLLVSVLLPGVGREVNGSSRWLSLGVFNLQPSEPAKLFVIVYLAGYLVRRRDELSSAFGGFVKPMAVMALVCTLLLAEPDFGAAAVLLATAMGMMFVAGVRIWQFAVLLFFVVIALVSLAISSPYRMERITAFMNPWADPFNSGFQLSQALIAFGRGEWFGVGLGSSIQKLFYLPEAHTDFLFAVIAEELGLFGSFLVIGMFGLLVHRIFVIGRRAEISGNSFAGLLAYGIAMWFGLQAFVNIGVNMGLLPTKGLTLPLMSYGGSSIVVMCAALAVVLRIDYETRQRHMSRREAR